MINICYPPRVAIVINIGYLSGLYKHGECGWMLQLTFNTDNIYRVLSRKVMVKPVNHKIAILQATYTLMRSDNMCMSHIHTHKPVRKWLRVCGSLFTVLTTIFSGKFPKMAIKAQNVYFYFLSGYVASYRRIKMLLFIRRRCVYVTKLM